MSFLSRTSCVNNDDDEVRRIVEDPPSRREDDERSEEPKRDQLGPFRIRHIGLLMAVISSFFFFLCSLIVRTVDSVGYLEHATMRFVGVLLPSVCLVIHGHHDPTGESGSRFVLFVRGVLGSVGLMFQFYAFQHMPLADASVLIFSAPIFVTIFARIFLKEPCGPTQIITVLVTVVGVILISRPPFLFGGTSQNYSLDNLLGAVSAISGTVCTANVYILLRKLKSLHYAVIMSSFASIGIIMSQAGSLALGTFCLPCDFFERLYLVLLGVFSFCGQVLLTKALQLEHAGPVSICRTADIVYAFVWQIAFQGEVPNAFSIVGAILVTTSVLVMAVRKWILELSPESQIRKRLSILIA